MLWESSRLAEQGLPEEADFSQVPGGFTHKHCWTVWSPSRRTGTLRLVRATRLRNNWTRLVDGDGVAMAPSGRDFRYSLQKISQEGYVEAVLAELENALGHEFAKPELLLCALTHRSLVNQQLQ